jgi:two-component system phosphate regulon sensor histidine kinase PhoR
MHNASTSIRAGLVAILAGTLLLAIVIATVWGATFWALVLAAGGEVIALLWLALASTTAHDRHTAVPGAQLSARAVPTRRQHLVAQLRDVRDAVSSLPDAVVLLDHQGHVYWRNAAAIHLLGLQQQHDERPLAERLAGSELGAWLGTDTRQAATDMPAPADPALRLSATMMAFGADRQLLLARDISTLSRLEQVRRDFVANVSHELRTPLTVIHGYLELLDPADVPELAPVLKEMRMQSQRMRQLVEDLLTLSRLETREALPDEHVPMAPLLVALHHEAEALSQGRHTITVVAGTDADLRGSRRDLHSAFSNLVSNAVRYTPSNGNIVISWQRTATGDAVFSVRDSGLGIPAEHLTRLTERFYRVSSSRSRESGGTGLGLSIVKHVLNLHQGRLVIASEPGQGSTFSCVLDASRVLPPESDDSTQAETPAD